MEFLLQVSSKNNKIYNVEIKETIHNFYECSIVNDKNLSMGMLTFKLEKPSIWIYSISVDEAFQNQGLGQALLDALEYIAIEKNCTKIQGKFYPSNKYAKPFYTKNNYLIIKDYYETFIYKWLDYKKVTARLKNVIIENQSIIDN